MVRCCDVGGSGSEEVLVIEASQENYFSIFTYVSKLSRPDGSYAETFRVCVSEILDRISAIVDFFNISRSYSAIPFTNEGSPSSVLWFKC